MQKIISTLLVSSIVAASSLTAATVAYDGILYEDVLWNPAFPSGTGFTAPGFTINSGNTVQLQARQINFVTPPFTASFNGLGHSDAPLIGTQAINLDVGMTDPFPSPDGGLTFATPVDSLLIYFGSGSGAASSDLDDGAVSFLLFGGESIDIVDSGGGNLVVAPGGPFFSPTVSNASSSQTAHGVVRISSPTPISSIAWAQDSFLGFDNIDFQIALPFDTVIEVVPEPGTVAILGVASIGLIAYLRRNKRKQA